MPAQKLSQEPGMAAVAGSLDEPTHSYRNEMDPLTHANHPMAPSTSTRIVAEAPDMHRAVVEQTHPHSQTHTSSSERSRGPATREDQPINVPLSQHGYATAQVQRRNGNSAVVRGSTRVSFDFDKYASTISECKIERVVDFAKRTRSTLRNN